MEALIYKSLQLERRRMRSFGRSRPSNIPPIRTAAPTTNQSLFFLSFSSWISEVCACKR